MYKIVTEYLDATAKAVPDKVAFATDACEMTFKTLRDDARAIASCIAKTGNLKKPIAVFIDKQPSCIAAMQSASYSGNFYTVLDVHMPMERILKIMGVLEPVIIITDREHLDGAENVKKEAGSNAEIIIYEDAVKTPVDEDKLAEIYEGQSSEDLFFVLFTSGSTGIPKGGMITHRATIHYLEFLREAFPIDRDTIYANQAPFYFIMSMFEIYSTIMLGATCYVIPKNVFSFPVMLLDWMKERHVNTIYWVPSIMCLIANFRALPEVHLDDLRLVMFGAEVMPSKQLNMWKREYPNAVFINQYGPTEMTDICAYYVVDREIDDDESLPIGKPASHWRIILLDESDKEVKQGEIGELCGTGPSIANGYYKEPAKTAEVFVVDPTDPEGKRMMYRTGDLAKIDERGDLIYIGRKDFQIKHMGNRIEPGEIETVITSLDGIDRACVVYDMKRKKIVLFYTGTASAEEITEAAAGALPDYMVPNRIERLDEMPFNLNGKIDRTQLKQLL